VFVYKSAVCLRCCFLFGFSFQFFEEYLVSDAGFDFMSQIFLVCLPQNYDFFDGVVGVFFFFFCTTTLNPP